ncbi:hypothetical protein QO010_003621 [Caulobacter ginsengisoli]|uniref:DUF1579 domain-containing protein n=1 Tax=Caulobacter ginsengisoli TaxID=400775 RepID=A0ABU0IUZ7_9CAUL|nr:DUF1579 domain-containing protein [Caulobacter ginsengisoli]MDQ0465829.1 hypothetical protein [Caulobacter ginsengisoli]
MTDTPTRRDAIAVTLAAAAFATTAQAAAPQPVSGVDLDRHRHDFDWLVGSWKVRHHRLKARLAGSTEWEDFDGTSKLWLTLDGLGTVDDNWLDIPSGAYRAVGIRAFNTKTGLWAIWWLDERYADRIEPPVYGGFKDGVGTFDGDDTFNGKPIKVRFQWSRITANSAHWEQAFSPDGGATWETNWTMEFTRA